VPGWSAARPQRPRQGPKPNCQEALRQWLRIAGSSYALISSASDLGQ